MAKGQAVNTANVRARARWVMELRSAHPSLGRDDVMDRVRKEFSCGKTAAEQILKVSSEMLADVGKDPQIRERVATGYLEVYETAMRRGDSQGDRNAIRALDSLRRHLGIGAPDRVEVTGSSVDDDEFEEMSAEQLEAIARLDARKKKAQPDE